MRNAFARAMTELAQERDDVCLLSGDIGNRMFDRYKEVAPSRFLNCGIAEANMMSMAAGMGAKRTTPCGLHHHPIHNNTMLGTDSYWCRLSRSACGNRRNRIRAFLCRTRSHTSFTRGHGYSSMHPKYACMCTYRLKRISCTIARSD